MKMILPRKIFHTNAPLQRYQFLGGLICCLIFSSASMLNAQSYYWDPNAQITAPGNVATEGGGAGTWDSSLLWYNSTTGLLEAPSSSSDLVFANTGGVVTWIGGPSYGSITVDAAGYTFTTNSSAALGVSGPITLNANATIETLGGSAKINLNANTITIDQKFASTYGSWFTGVGGNVVKTGSGSLELGDFNTDLFTGKLTVNEGIVKLTAPITYFSGASFEYQANAAGQPITPLKYQDRYGATGVELTGTSVLDLTDFYRNDYVNNKWPLNRATLGNFPVSNDQITLSFTYSDPGAAEGDEQVVSNFTQKGMAILSAVNATANTEIRTGSDNNFLVVDQSAYGVNYTNGVGGDWTNKTTHGAFNGTIGKVEGSGDFYKVGAGNLEVLGRWSHTGNVIIGEGTLKINAADAEAIYNSNSVNLWGAGESQVKLDAGEWVDNTAEIKLRSGYGGLKVKGTYSLDNTTYSFSDDINPYDKRKFTQQSVLEIEHDTKIKNLQALYVHEVGRFLQINTAPGSKIDVGDYNLTIEQNVEGFYSGYFVGGFDTVTQTYKGQVTKTGAATLNLYSIGGSGQFSRLNINEGKIIATASSIGTADVHLSGTGQLQFHQIDVGTYGGQIFGAGGELLLTGYGTLEFIKQQTGFTGTLTVQSYTNPNNQNENKMTLQVSVEDGFSAVDSINLKGLSRIDSKNLKQTFRNLSGDPGSTIRLADTADKLFTIDNTANTTFSGTISGGGSLEKKGTGSLTLDPYVYDATTGTFVRSFNDFTGTTTVAAGTLKLASADAISKSSEVTILNGATLQADNIDLNLPTLNVASGGNINLGTGKLTLTQTVDKEISGQLVAQGGLVKAGAARLSLLGTSNDFGSNAITVNDGVLAIATPAAIGASDSKPMTIALGSGSSVGFGIHSDDAVTIDNNYAVTITGGTGSFEKLGSGTTTLASAEKLQYTIGSVKVSGGTLKINNGVNLPTQLTLNGGDLDTDGRALTLSTLAGTGGAVILGSADVTVNVGADSTFAGTFNTAGALIKGGSAILDLSGDNASSLSSTRVSEGTLRLQAGGKASEGTMAVSAGATFDMNGVAQTLKGLTGDAGASVALGAADLTFNPDASTSYSFAGVISGAGGVVKEGAGTQVLGGANSYTGVTTVNAGTLEVGYQDLSTAARVNIADGATFALNQAAGTSATLSGVTATGGSANGAFVKKGAGTVTLSVDTITPTPNTYGSLSVEEGKLIATSGALAAAVNTINIGSSGNFALDIGAGSTNSTTLAKNFTGTGAFTVEGNGNTFTIDSDLGNGSLVVGASLANTTLSISANQVAGLGGLTGVADATVNVINQALTLNQDTDTVFLSDLTGDQNITKNGTGTLVLDADGATTRGTYTGTLSITSGGFGFDTTSGNSTYTNALTGLSVTPASLAFSKTGSNTLTMDSNVALGGSMTVAEGALTVNDTFTVSALGLKGSSTSADLSLGGATANVTLNGNTNGGSASQPDYSYAGIVTGTGTLQKTGTSIQKIGDINSSTVTVNVADNGGTLIADFADGATNTVTVGNTAEFGFETSGNKTFAGNLTGGASNSVLAQYGSGTVTITQAGSVTGFSLLRIVSGDIIDLTGAIYQLDAELVGTLTLRDGVDYQKSIQGTGGVIVDNNVSAVFSTVKKGYTGTTTLNSGTLTLNVGDAIMESQAIQFNGGTLLVNADQSFKNLAGNSGTLSISGTNTVTINSTAATTELGATISGSSATVTKADANKLTLTGNNTIGTFNQNSGDVLLTGNNTVSTFNVNDGTLELKGDSNVFTGNINVADGKTLLGGSGRILGNVALASGARFSPGNSPGTVTIQGNISGSGATYVQEFSASSSLPQADKLIMDGGIADLTGMKLEVLNASSVTNTNVSIIETINNGSIQGVFSSIDAAGNSIMVLYPQFLGGETGKLVIRSFSVDGTPGNYSFYSKPENATNSNQRAVAAVLDSLLNEPALNKAANPNSQYHITNEGGNAIITSTVGQSSAVVRTALNEISPHSYGALQVVTVAQNNSLRKSIQDRMSLKRAAFAGQDVRDLDSEWQVFTMGNAAVGTYEEDTFNQEMDVTAFGTTVGGEYDYKDGTVGAFFNYGRSSGDLTNPGGDLTADSFKFGAFGSNIFATNLYIDYLLYGGFDQFEMQRRVLGSSVTAEPDGTQVGGAVGVGYKFDNISEGFHITPNFTLSASHLSVDGFSESGAVGSMTVDGFSTNSYQARLGVGFDYEFLKPSLMRDSYGSVGLDLAYVHEFGDENTKIKGRLNGTNTQPINVTSGGLERNYMLFGANFTYRFTPKFTFDLNWDLLLNSFYAQNNFYFSVTFWF